MNKPIYFISMMRRNRTLRHLLMLPLWIALPANASEAVVPPKGPEVQQFEMIRRDAPRLSADLSGGFAATAAGSLIVGGRMTAGETEISIQSLPLENSGNAVWTKAEARVPLWSAVVQSGDDVVCAGGLLQGQPTDRVLKLILSNNRVSVAELPKLPKPLAGAGAAVIGTKLLVFGGLSSVQPPVFENGLWTLDFEKTGAQWVAATQLPGPGRAFAAVTAQFDALCVFGGLSAGSDAATSVSNEAWMFRLTPPEASFRSGWTKVADVPHPTVGAVAFPVGPSAVALVGGSEVPPAALFPTSAELTASRAPTLFHTITDAWCDFNQPLGVQSVLAARQTLKLDTKFLLLGTVPGSDEIRLSEFKLVRTVRSLSWVDYLVIGCYFLFIATIGMIASRRQKSSADFSLAGRNVPWWVAGISMFATGASAISFMAIPALAFSTNLVFLFPIVVYVMAYFVQSRLIFPLLRRMEITSTYEYLERRFNRTLRLIASAQCIVFQTFGRASVVLVLPALAISATTGISVYVSLVMMWAVTTVYTAAGGFQAVVYTDVFQGILKFVAPLCMIGLCIFTIPGGVKEFVHIGMLHHKFDFALVTWDATLPAVWILFIATFMAGTIVQAGDQPTIQRVFSSPQKEVRRVAAMSAACAILISIVTNVLGIAIFAYFHANPAQLDPLAQNDKIVPLFVIQALPHGFVGMVIAAIFASAMTTVASSMNSSATVFTEDFYMRFRPNATDKQRVRVLRISSTLVGLVALGIALLLATLNLKSLMVTWSIISALLGGGIVGVFSLGMFTRRANGFGAVSGAILSIVITALVKFYTPLHWQTLIPIAILSCMVTGYFFSLFSPQSRDLSGLTVYTPKKSIGEVE